MSRSCTATGRLLFTSAVPGDTVLVQTRRGALVQDRSPGLVAAAEAQMPHGLVLDGAARLPGAPAPTPNAAP
ncbi:hypothetical protein OG753_07370 [Streptomyces sp. NBC_00029]|uniref:hypothetical protein n=1 Tax=Streptomyces sp. NBC_00029 TaxID=2903613 RepID=UPI00324A3F5A